MVSEKSTLADFVALILIFHMAQCAIAAFISFRKKNFSSFPVQARGLEVWGWMLFGLKVFLKNNLQQSQPFYYHFLPALHIGDMWDDGFLVALATPYTK